MVDQRFFAHVSPSGQTIDDRLGSYIAGTRSYRIGENLAWGKGVLGTPAATVNAWMRSQGHRDNILNAGYDEVGVGIAAGSPNGGRLDAGATYATAFGSAGGSSPTHASSATVSADYTPRAAKKATKKLKKLSAKTKRKISKQCHRVARRTKTSAKKRRARYARCVKTRTRAVRKVAR